MLVGWNGIKIILTGLAAKAYQETKDNLTLPGALICFFGQGKQHRMNQKLKTILLITPLTITILVILIALALFLLDFQFLRLVELKTLDLRIASRGDLAPGDETVIAAHR